MDSLYQQHNIIGYTQGGGQRQQPTVYFRSGSGSGDEWGHITQEHGDRQNVGRGAPIKDPNYRFGNIGKGSGKHLFELSPRTGVQHDSRGKFIPVVQGSKEQSDLAQAIVDHPEIKPKYQGKIATLKSRADI